MVKHSPEYLGQSKVSTLPLASGRLPFASLLAAGPSMLSAVDGTLGYLQVVASGAMLGILYLGRSRFEIRQAQLMPNITLESFATLTGTARQLRCRAAPQLKRWALRERS